MRWYFLLLLGALACTLTPAPVFAHALHLAYAIKKDRIEIEAFYDDNTPAIKAEVQVVDARENIVVSGVTDAEGTWHFMSPAPGRYQIRVDAGAGHRAKKLLEVPAPESAPSSDSATDPAVAAPASREELTGIPWLRLALGLALIAGAGGGLILGLRRRRNDQT